MEIINLSTHKISDGPNNFIYRENAQSVLLGSSLILFFGYSKTVGNSYHIINSQKFTIFQNKNGKFIFN